MPTLEVILIPEPEAGSNSSSLNDLLSEFSKSNGDIAGLTLLNGDLILRLSASYLVIQLRIKNGGTGIDPEMRIYTGLDINYSARNLIESLLTIFRRMHPYKTKQTRIGCEALISVIIGRSSGHSYKQIAVEIFGEDRVEGNRSKSVMDDVTYRINLAHKIMEDSYQEFVSGHRSFFKRYR